jgi:hypothetical protein
MTALAVAAMTELDVDEDWSSQGRACMTVRLLGDSVVSATEVGSAADDEDAASMSSDVVMAWVPGIGFEKSLAENILPVVDDTGAGEVGKVSTQPYLSKMLPRPASWLASSRGVSAEGLAAVVVAVVIVACRGASVFNDALGATPERSNASLERAFSGDIKSFSSASFCFLLSPVGSEYVSVVQ